jgi:DoxX-like family
MKPLTGLYWTSTGLLAAFMLMASVPDILQSPLAVDVFRHLGYPTYLLLFIGTAKILGVAAVLFPVFARVKEWAYAGLVFDLTGALHSHLSVGDPAGAWSMPIIGLVLVTASYVFYRQTLIHPASVVSRE